MLDKILIWKNPITFGRSFHGTRNLIFSSSLNIMSQTSKFYCVNFNSKDAFCSFCCMTTSG